MIGIKKVRGYKSYYDNSHKNLLSLDEYYRRANNIIFVYGRTYPYVHAYDSDDLRGMIVEYMINGDLKYNPEKMMSLENYRYSNGVYGINSYINTVNSVKNKIHNEQERFVCYEQSDNLNKNPDFLTELRDEIDSILKCPKLTEKQREVLQLYYLDKLSISTIAQELGVNRQAVQQIIKRAIKNVKEWLKISEKI